MHPSFKLNPEEIFATLADLVSINSVNPYYPGGPGEGLLAEYVGEFFRRNSIPFTYQPVFEGRPNVIAALAGRSGERKLILEAHMDTASELGMSIEPFRPVRKNNSMYGRGSCDTKAGLAAMMHAFKAVSDAGLQPRASAVLVAAADEEHAFRGIVKFLEAGVKAEGAVVAEPTSLETVVASRGVLRWRICTRGRTAHSSKPHLGINAITKMSKFIVALDEKLLPYYRMRQHPLLGSPALTVGTIQGGIQVNQVPESCSIEIDRRLLPGETQQTVWKELSGLISELEVEDPELKLEMEPPVLEDLAMETPASERIVQVAGSVSQEVRGTSNLVGVPYGSDASKLSRARIPSIILGPGSIDRAHAAEEYVELDQVALAAEIYTRIVLEF
ncbi:MAG: M20 family metallopeptidase [Terriglobia bacterium]|jgi:acetylornithine deacetylase